MKGLPKLLADNRGKGMFAVQNRTQDEATIYLYDTIVMDDLFGGVTPKQFVDELNDLDVPIVHLRINSPGGDVFAARAMEQAVRDYRGEVIAHIDGLAASAASVVALAADEVRIAEGGFIMIHRAWTISAGDADDMLATAELLEKVDETLVDTYVARTRQPADAIRDWMQAVTWFNAEEAIKYGFADTLESGVQAKTDWDLSAYGNAPKISAGATEHLMRKLAIIVGSNNSMEVNHDSYL